MPSVAILGASSNRDKFGNKSVRAHQLAGYEVFPVNPRGGTIEGIDAFTALSEIDQTIDRISVYLPPAILAKTLEDIAATKCREVWLNPGCDSADIVDRCDELGIETIRGCSIVDLGMTPSEVDAKS